MTLHAAWTGGRLHLWAESWAERPTPSAPEVPSDGEAVAHRRAVRPDPTAGVPSLTHALMSVGASGEPGEIRLKLPASAGEPVPSPQAARAGARAGGLTGAGGIAAGPITIASFSVPTLSIGASEAARVLGALADEESAGLTGGEGPRGVTLGDSVRWFEAASRFARHLLAQQRFVPLLRQDSDGVLTGVWSPWLSDERSAERAAALVRSMPPSARAAEDELGHHAWAVLNSFLTALTDAACREVLAREEMRSTIEDADAGADAQFAWLAGLLDAPSGVPAHGPARTDMARRVRRWIGGLDDRGESSAWRLGLRLTEPVMPPGSGVERPNDSARWSVSFFLESLENPLVRVDAADIWLVTRESIVVDGIKLDSPQDVLIAELGRASRFYKPVEGVLDQSEPVEVLLSTKQAYEFLREHKPVLSEQGFSVIAPAWWDSPLGRLGARLKIDSEPMTMLDVAAGGSASTASGGPRVGLSALVGYHWEIAVGDTTLTLAEFEKFAKQPTPLVRIGGRWVEIRPEDVQNAVKFIKENPGGQMSLMEAMRLAYTTDVRQTGVPVIGLDASGWVADLFNAAGASSSGGGDSGGTASISMPELHTPASFHGTLRPYQQRGLSWLAFMERFGFGCCLADDMGLGKTVQLLALLAHEREASGGEPVAPTLLIVPMSVVGNWVKEAARFTPQLKIMVHHGLERLQGEAFTSRAAAADMVITTYALAHRDRQTLGSVPFGRVVLDEAQFVKNPAAKQSQSVRSFEVARRVALTGTPVENRLSELWSIMDFLNPGYLGGATQFRTRFGVPIERYRDQHRLAQLRGLVRPFILRRVKTDPLVVSDLPEKLETKDYSVLTPEQAELYESCVSRMLRDVEASEGIHRRGLVLSALIRLKQICDHPSLMLKDHDSDSPRPADPRRSGKCVRLLEMLDEVLSEGEQSLIFTQFRQMAQMLAGMLRHELGRDVLLLHGGTSQSQRQEIIERFQAATGQHPILILSLKAGGVGLNLTAATHVFHFDRWWNPAVENQATDRAFRIGQTRTVQVHKFVVRGTLEERIDEMIESKTELAENIIGQGERWLTELDTDQLRELLTLRTDAIADAAEEVTP
jgi:superfamily II DNA or RNA helicase